ncbi:MAG TPA: M1 family peptidase, partial [Puia sp.]|nr:M1 family peptidase [Puia sp.]
MKHKLLAFFLFICVNARSQQAWQQEVNYRMDVSLDTREHALNGFAKIQYINHSPDTLHYIWFHLWPNAYKNDRTAFSDQLLENGKTDFYFSDKEDKGYINRLDFRVNGEIAELEDHPQYIDIVKLVLPTPLLPHDSIQITTPFFEKLPYNISRGGHVKNSYQLTQWYPKPAVYDKYGWHPMPYLDQGEFFGEFGRYDVRITVPRNYVVAATGILQDEEENNWLKSRKNYHGETKKPTASNTGKKTQQKTKTGTKSPGNILLPDTAMKTIQYLQNNIHDFAWFADQDYIVETDTVTLPSGKIIQIQSFYYTSDQESWKNSVSFTKEAIHFHSA